MTMTTKPEAPTATASPIANSLTAGRLPNGAPWLILGAAVAVAAATFGVVALAAGSGFDWGGALLVGALLYIPSIWLFAMLAEGRRRAMDRLVTALVVGAFVLAMIPLISLTITVVTYGLARFDADFFSMSMRNITGEGGGIVHAIVGTLLMTGTAAIISIPIGLMTSIYLVEYGRGRLARGITFLVDVMTGIPSIVAGLFALSLFVLILGPSVRFGFGGSVALSLLMIPTVVRSTEEMLRLVPDDLREAAYALGVPKWRTISKVVIPTALGGIVTGVMLAISRVIGETAPLLVVAGFTDSVNTNLFSDRMMTLPVFIFTQYSNSTEKGYAYAWGGALVLIFIVMVLNLIARIIGKIFAPKTGR
jgi:phosphate transport system permease protein